MKKQKQKEAHYEFRKMDVQMYTQENWRELAEADIRERETKIRKACDAIEQSEKTVVERAIEAGEALYYVQDRLVEGHWEKWLKEKELLKPWTAQRYVRLYRHREKVREAKPKSLREALQVVAQKKKPKAPSWENQIARIERAIDTQAADWPDEAIQRLAQKISALHESRGGGQPMPAAASDGEVGVIGDKMLIPPTDLAIA